MPNTPLFQRGLDQLKAGNYAEARKLFAENEEQAGTTKQTQERLAQAEALLAKGDMDGAAGLFTQVQDSNPGLPDAYLGLARIGLFTGQVADAKTHATAANKLAPNIPLTWTLLGLVHEASNQPAEALPLLQKGAELGAQSFLCNFNLGRFLASVGKGDEALPFLQKAAGLEPNTPDVHTVLGFAYRQGRQYEKAIKAFEKAKDLAPKSVEAYATLADVLYEVKEFKVARQIVEQGLKACGDNPILLEKGLACCLMLDDVETAIYYVERELKVAPDHEQGWLNLAQLYLLNKDVTRSELTAKKLLEKNPKQWEAWLHLADLNDGLSKDDEAEKAYRKAVELSPKGEWKAAGNFGAFLVQTSDPKKHAEGKKILEQAASAAPKGELRPVYNLALAHVRLKEDKKALELVASLKQQLPEDHPLFTEVKKLESNLKEKK